MKTLTPAEVLDLPMGDNDSGADTVRGYLVALLATLWDEGEGFGGKRPFGNSGWECELHNALVVADVIAGTVDDDGTADHDDCRDGDRVIAQAIEALGTPG